MNPKVAELLEGKSDDEKFQAIAFSLACLLTRPTANSPPDAPMKGKDLNYVRFTEQFTYDLMLS